MTKEEKFQVRLRAVGVASSEDYVRFDSLSGLAARALLQSGAADAKDQQNDAPTFEEITEFLEQHPAFMGHGYIIGPGREDERITLEGVISTAHLSTEDTIAFANMFAEAGEFEVSEDYARAWYD